jgi:hypothetical protein
MWLAVVSFNVTNTLSLAIWHTRSLAKVRAYRSTQFVSRDRT